MSALPFGPSANDQYLIRCMMDAVIAFQGARQAYQVVDCADVDPVCLKRLKDDYDYARITLTSNTMIMQGNGVFDRCLEALEAQSHG